MTKLKNSLIAFAGLMLLAGILAVLRQGVGQGQQKSGGNSPARALRRYCGTSEAGDVPSP